MAILKTSTIQGILEIKGNAIITQESKIGTQDILYENNFVPSQYPDFRGQTGDVGLTGFTGSRGAVGSTGPVGATGDRGPSPQGFTGSIGLTGFTGSVGAVGAQGPQGSTGSVGAEGSQGPTGYRGSQGATGASSSLRGFTGSRGATGDTGARGATGSTGPAGFRGSQGPAGPAGFTGSVGAVGITPSAYTGGGSHNSTSIGVLTVSGSVSLIPSSNGTGNFGTGTAGWATVWTGNASYQTQFSFSSITKKENLHEIKLPYEKPLPFSYIREKIVSKDKKLLNSIVKLFSNLNFYIYDYKNQKDYRKIGVMIEEIKEILDEEEDKKLYNFLIEERKNYKINEMGFQDKEYSLDYSLRIDILESLKTIFLQYINYRFNKVNEEINKNIAILQGVDNG